MSREGSRADQPPNTPLTVAKMVASETGLIRTSFCSEGRNTYAAAIPKATIATAIVSNPNPLRYPNECTTFTRVDMVPP